MKKQTFIKGSLLLAIVSVITINVALCSNKNKQKLQLDSFNIEALTQNIDGGMGERKYGPADTEEVGECDQRYIIYYSLNGNKATVHHTAAGAKVDIPFKLGNASANASYDGNWDKKNSNVIILERAGGRKVDPKTIMRHCKGGENNVCYEFLPCEYAANESRASWQADINYLISLQ